MIFLSLILPLLGFVVWGTVTNYSHRWVGNDPAKSIVFGFFCFDGIMTIGSHAPCAYFFATAPDRFGFIWLVAVLLLIALVIAEYYSRAICVVFDAPIEKKKAFMLCPHVEDNSSSLAYKMTIYACRLSYSAYVFLPVIGLVLGLVLALCRQTA